MKPFVAYALQHPVFNPLTDINHIGHFWRYKPFIHAGLTCNIGME
jgi:hypothetical protein